MSLHILPLPEVRSTYTADDVYSASEKLSERHLYTLDLKDLSFGAGSSRSPAGEKGISLAALGLQIALSRMNNTSEAVTVHASQTSGPDPLSGTGEGEADAGTARVTADPVVKRMSGALDTVGRRDDELSSVMADALRLAIVTRVLSLRAAEPAQRPADHARKPRPEKSGLQKWRFKRVVDYVSANLGEPITLQDMASVAGLSRMHFAAQFRIATGTRPHEFLLRQRVERAQEMMASSDTPLVAIALDVGFQTQAHFTSVFKRITGETPHRWRGRKELEQARV